MQCCLYLLLLVYKRLEFSGRVGTIVDPQKVLKQAAGVVYAQSYKPQQLKQQMVILSGETMYTIHQEVK